MTRTRALVGALLVLLARHAGAEPAPTSRLQWVTNGTVRAATVRDQTLFIGGSFTRVAPAQNLLGPWFGVSTATGVPLPPLPVTDAPVSAIEPDGAGGYFVGGRFTQIGGVARPALARVLADGRVDAQFNPPFVPAPGGARPEVRTLARSAGVLYVGGLFAVAGAPTGWGLAAFDVGSGAVRPWHPGLPVLAEKIIAAGSRVFVVAGPGSPTVWSLDPVTAATQWSRWLISGAAYDAVLAGGRLVVVGPFYAANDVRGLASLDPETGLVDPAWGPEWPMFPGHPEVNAVTVVGSTVYVGGSFADVGGQRRANAAAIDLDTGALTSWAPQVDGTVRDMVPAPGGSVYLAGAFRRVDGQSRDALAQVDAAGALTSWTAGAYSTDVRTLCVAGDTLLAGGATAVAGGVARQNLAAFALDADDVRPWAPAMPHVVTDLTSHGPLIFAGLAHRSPSVLPAGQASVVAFDASSGLPSAWTPPENDAPWDLVGLVDGLVYLFSSGFTSRFVRVDAQTGALDPQWRVNAYPSPTPRLFPAGDVIYLAGGWFSVDGTSRLYLAAVDRRTGALTAWNTRALVTPPEGQLTVGGVAITGQSMYLDTSTPFGTEVLGIDLDTGLRITPYFLGTVRSSGVLAVADGWLLVTRPAAGSGDLEIRALGSDGVLSSWNPNLRQAVPWDLAGLAPVRIVTSDTDVIITNVTGGSGAPVYGVAVLPRRASSFPTALDAVARSNVVRLSWTGTEPPAASYVVEAGSEPGRVDIASFRTGTSATSLEALAGAGTYFVRIRAEGPGAPGPPSNEIAVAVAGCPGTAPSPPTRLAATMNGTTVTLAWEPSADVVLSYVIEAGSRDGAADLARIAVPGDQTRFTTEAPPGTYFVRVRANTTCGPSGTTPDIWLAVGQGTLPSAPTGLTVTGAVPVYTASWQPVAGAYYVLEVGSAPGLADVARIVTVTTTVGPAAVTPGATYYLRVRAIGVAGVGPPGQEVVLTAR